MPFRFRPTPARSPVCRWLCALALAATAAWLPWPVGTQGLGTLVIRVALPDSTGVATPVPNYVLLVSDNPATALPRRLVTSRDGTVTTRLRPGTYTVESDRPIAFEGKVYQWTQILDVGADSHQALELTAHNADSEASGAPVDAPSVTALENDPDFLLSKWQDAVVGVWTPTARTSGFLADASGLIVTNERGVGNAATAEVQLSPTRKVAATVLVSDLVRDVAVLSVAASVASGLPVVPLACDRNPDPALEVDQDIFTIGYPLWEPKGLADTTIVRTTSGSIRADAAWPLDETGGPVFSREGAVVGLTSPVDPSQPEASDETRIVPTRSVCAVLELAARKMATTAPPAADPLPTEPAVRFPASVLDDMAKRRAGSVSAYHAETSTFDVAFITPVMMFAARERSRADGREWLSDPRQLAAAPPATRALTHFASWATYVEETPPVLLVRVTPRLEESFWATLARGAARTQGMALPPIVRFKSGFSRLQVFCGATDVRPIHALHLDQRGANGDALTEGLIVLAPDAIGPRCGTVKLVAFSEKEPRRGESLIVEPNVVQQVWDDFEPYRALGQR
ncbi:MAG: trypsin-like peptidase domain-containing protein [Vicinamibacterales bacterium]